MTAPPPGPAIGSELLAFLLPVDVSKAREMALALGSTDPRWASGDPEALRDAPVVPTFTACAEAWQDRTSLYTRVLGLRTTRTLHGEQSYAFARRPRVGETLRGSMRLTGSTQKTGRGGGGLRLVELTTTYRDAHEAEVLRDVLTLVETGDPPARLAGEPRADRPAGPAPGAPPDGAPVVPPRELGPLTRTDIVRYAGAAGDLNVLHHDDTAAGAEGLPSLFAMGMLHAGWAAAHLDEHLHDRALRSLRMRFTSRVWPGDTLRLTVRRAGPDTCELAVRNQGGEVVLTGTADIPAHAAS